MLLSRLNIVFLLLFLFLVCLKHGGADPVWSDPVWSDTIASDGNVPGVGLYQDEGETNDEGDGEGESITAAAFPAHVLGDQTLSINAGVFIPLFFQEFAGSYHATNLSLGGVGNLQWNAYLSPYWRIGLEIGGSFSFSPNSHTLLMLPFTLKLAYVITVSRFEFPIFLGAGVNLIRYREWSHLDIIVKPGFGAYWRQDLNWSFGLNVVWWLDFQYADINQSTSQARMGNFLEVTPSLFYHF